MVYTYLYINKFKYLISYNIISRMQPFSNETYKLIFILKINIQHYHFYFVVNLFLLLLC